MWILEVSTFYHNSAAFLLEDGRIVAAAREDRFTRKKHDAEFLQNTIRYCFDAGASRLDQIDRVVFFENPFLKFKRLLFAEHHQCHAASAFFTSPFEDAIALTMDDAEEWTMCAANRSSAVRRMFSSVPWGQRWNYL